MDITGQRQSATCTFSRPVRSKPVSLGCLFLWAPVLNFCIYTKAEAAFAKKAPAATSAPSLVSSDGWWQGWRSPAFYRPGSVCRDPLIHPSRLHPKVGALPALPDPQAACPRFRQPPASPNLQSGKDKSFRLPDSWDHLFQIILCSPNVYNLTPKQQPTHSDPAPSGKLDLDSLP